MTLAIPISKSVDFKNENDLLFPGEDKVQLPEWTEPLLNVSAFLHFFRGEANLPQKLTDQIFKKSTNMHKKHQLDNVIVVRKVPSKHGRYTRTWITKRLIELLTVHQARIIDPWRDICVLDDEEEPEKFHSVVIFMDNFHHFRPNDKEEAEGELSDADESAPKIV